MCASPKKNPEREREKEESLDQLTPPQRQLAKTELKVNQIVVLECELMIT